MESDKVLNLALLREEMVWGSEGKSPHILSLALKMSGQFHAPIAFPLGKIPLCPFDTMVCGLHVLSAGFRGDKTVLLVILKPHLLPGLRSLSLVTILTELTRLVFVKILASCFLSVSNEMRLSRSVTSKTVHPFGMFSSVPSSTGVIVCCNWVIVCVAMLSLVCHNTESCRPQVNDIWVTGVL